MIYQMDTRSTLKKCLLTPEKFYYNSRWATKFNALVREVMQLKNMELFMKNKKYPLISALLIFCASAETACGADLTSMDNVEFASQNIDGVHSCDLAFSAYAASERDEKSIFYVDGGLFFIVIPNKPSFVAFVKFQISNFSKSDGKLGKNPIDLIDYKIDDGVGGDGKYFGGLSGDDVKEAGEFVKSVTWSLTNENSSDFIFRSLEKNMGITFYPKGMGSAIRAEIDFKYVKNSDGTLAASKENLNKFMGCTLELNRYFRSLLKTR